MRPFGILQNGQVCDDIEAFFEDLREQLILPISIVADDGRLMAFQAGLRRTLRLAEELLALETSEQGALEQPVAVSLREKGLPSNLWLVWKYIFLTARK